MTPGPWSFVLLALAAYRTWKLVGDDVITEPLRKRWLTGRDWWEALITCPWCAGAYIAVAWWAVWQSWPHETLVAASAFAVSSAVGAFATAVNALAE